MRRPMNPKQDAGVGWGGRCGGRECGGMTVGYVHVLTTAVRVLLYAVNVQGLARYDNFYFTLSASGIQHRALGRRKVM
jgi:hypothetical protein